MQPNAAQGTNEKSHLPRNVISSLLAGLSIVSAILTSVNGVGGETWIVLVMIGESKGIQVANRMKASCCTGREHMTQVEFRDQYLSVNKVYPGSSVSLMSYIGRL